jgi:hypothetical protein
MARSVLAAASAVGYVRLPPNKVIGGSLLR